MRVIVTCGPSYEPIDQVRRITNFSTGELGLRLADRLASAGHQVTCFRGEGATWHDPRVVVGTVPFATNRDLLAKLETEAGVGGVGAVLHAAALADFTVAAATAGKIPSDRGNLNLTLVPAVKLLGKLRALFPTALIVGWKYELDGGREAVIERARRQMIDCRTDASVINGAAYGTGFGFVEKGGKITHLPTKSALAEWIARWLKLAATRQSHPQRSARA